MTKKQKEISNREKKVLLLTCKEKTNAEIAKILKISERTVEGHKSAIYKKTKAKSAIGIFIYALKNKIVKLS